MSQKTFVMICFTIGSIAGSYLPVFIGVDPLSITSLFLGAIGGIIGIIIGFKLGGDLS